ncbi:MAG: recombinase family protein, partial [Lachnospiraceae bacterium]|nr:recombinase family protein [Lachnospiraceae bacterium]
MLSSQTIRKFGYARVSSKDQNLARQITALKEVGIEGKNIYSDKWSGKDFDRPSYKRLMDDIHEEDELY